MAKRRLGVGFIGSGFNTRFHMQAWHYYVAGFVFLAAMVVLHAIDQTAAARRDQAVQAARHAQEAYEIAQRLQRDVGDQPRHGSWQPT